MGGGGETRNKKGENIIVQSWRVELAFARLVVEQDVNDCRTLAAGGGFLEAIGRAILLALAGGVQLLDQGFFGGRGGALLGALRQQGCGAQPGASSGPGGG